MGGAMAARVPRGAPLWVLCLVARLRAIIARHCTCIAAGIINMQIHKKQ